jgi:hypothetical protein
MSDPKDLVSALADVCREKQIEHLSYHQGDVSIQISLKAIAFSGKATHTITPQNSTHAIEFASGSK